MKNRMNQLNVKSLMMASMSALLLASCTKSLPMKPAALDDKERVESASLFDQNAEYIYSASQQNASRSATDALPFSSSDNKRVKIQIDEDTLRVVEMERDQRYAANKANNKLVLEVPIEHIQFQCAKDRYGECTNSEEKATDIPWNQRNSIKIKFETAKFGQIDLLPILSSHSLGEDCYTDVSSKIVGSEVTSDAINFQIERTFTVNVGKEGCDAGDDANGLSDATVTAVYHYSMVKADSVLSKDFKPISYPEGSDDEHTFGFFSSKRNLLDVDNNNTDKSTVQIMNHWNPNRKEIVYYLSDEFAKPENKMVKDLTYKTIDNLNAGLAQAGVGFRINLKDPAGKLPGDIRNSMIVLVEDPVASSVIGYGPQTEDPVTGEIISARTIMFLGTIKKYIKYTYDQILREKRDSAPQKTLAAQLTLSDAIKNKVALLKSTGKVAGASGLLEQIQTKIAADAHAKGSAQGASVSAQVGHSPSVSVNSPKAGLNKIMADVKNYTAHKNSDYSGQDFISKMRYLQEAKNCAYTPPLQGGAGSISQKLMNRFPDDAKPWAELSNAEKDAVIAIILPEIWIPTLIHEMGHNLGLRHNFAGSEDKDNYPTADDLAKMGSDHQIPFSSVMDYGDDLKTLPMLGKYDIAALRFGYLRKVDVASGDQTITTDVPDTLNALNASLNDMDESIFEANPKVDVTKLPKLKEYQYCTDENLGINAGCKQFDLGSTYTEIVQNMIKDYEDGYTKRNLRDGRASMSLMDDLKYRSRINMYFHDMRVMLEVVERIKYANNLTDDSKQWETDPTAKDLRQAALLAGSFLTNVLMVPDTMCGIANKSAPNVITDVVPLSVFNDQTHSKRLSCYDYSLGGDDIIVAQGGKAFNSAKDPDSTNAYVDQIDVRGIWLDKVAAIRNLTSRKVGELSMDEHADTFLDMPELRQGILTALNGLLTNNVVNKVTFTMKDGSKADIELSYDMDLSQVVARPMILSQIDGAPESVLERWASRLGVRTQGTTPLQQILAQQVAWSAQDYTDEHPEDKVIGTQLSILRLNPTLPQKLSKTARSVIFENVQYVADETNVVARAAMDNLAKADVFETFLANFQPKDPKAQVAMLTQIGKAKAAKTPMPTGASADETAQIKEVWKLTAEDVQDFLSGVLKSTDYYKQTLRILPNAI